MYMMFVDESGDTGYPKNNDWSKWGGSLFYSRVGVVIHGWKWKTWNRRLDKFKKDHNLTWDAEIKAKHIRDGSGVFAGWDPSGRNQFLQDLLTLIRGNMDITLFGVGIDKRKVNISSRDRIVRPEIRSMELLLERYNLFLENQKHKWGIVILDPLQPSNDDNVRYFQSYLQERSQNLQPSHIVEGTFFAKSHTSNMIQIADVCSNIFYRSLVRTKNWEAEMELIRPRFWKQGSRTIGYGIKIWP